MVVEVIMDTAIESRWLSDCFSINLLNSYELSVANHKHPLTTKKWWILGMIRVWLCLNLEFLEPASDFNHLVLWVDGYRRMYLLAAWLIMRIPRNSWWSVGGKCSKWVLCFRLRHIFQNWLEQIQITGQYLSALWMDKGTCTSLQVTLSW